MCREEAQHNNGDETMITVTNLTEAQNRLVNEVLDSVNDKTSVHGVTRRTARGLVELGLGSIVFEKEYAEFSLSWAEFRESVTIVEVEVLSFGRFTTAVLNKLN